MLALLAFDPTNPDSYTVTILAQDPSFEINHCLSGLGEARLSGLQFVGGSVDELVACASSIDVGALNHYQDGLYTAYFLKDPDLINQDCRNRFRDGVPAGESLTATRDSIGITTPFDPQNNWRTAPKRFLS